MRLHRFFVDEELNKHTIGDEITLSDSSLAFQLKKIFRFEAGDKVVLVNNGGYEYVAQVVYITREDVKLELVEKQTNTFVPKREVYFFMSIIKKDNFEWVLQKGTELGVMHFVPILSERSEKKNINMERAKKIIVEASEQSGKGTLPTFYDPVKLSEALETFNVPSVAFDPEGKHYEQKDFDQNVLGVYIGPEGGWSPNEIEKFKIKNIPVLSLGDQILRAETAGVSIGSLLLL